MKKIINLIACVFLTTALFGQTYNFKVDLNKLEKDRLFVELECPNIKDDNPRYVFPSVIPGYYSEINYGNFISGFTAYDSSGKKIKVKKINENVYEIENGKQLSKITYYVDDTWDDKKGKDIHAAAGTNFEKGKVFVFNNGGLFGFFQGYNNLPIRLKVTKPNEFYGITSLPEIERSEQDQIFEANNYNHLIDCPILFSEPDTSKVRIGKTNFTIAVYSETGKKLAKSIYKEIIPSINAIKDFTENKLPVEKYTLLIYLTDFTELKDGIYGSGDLTMKQKIKMFKASPGALEHNNSSFYYYPDLGLPESYMYYIKRTVPHEILHVYSPLNLRSEIVDLFDYINPKMSKHLWLYEGVTDYLSWQLKLQNNLLSLGDFLGNELRGKMFEATKFPEDVSITEWSSRILEEPYNEQFGQAYNKGTVTAMLLDFEIMRLTKGEKQLKDIVFELCEKYGKNNPFNEDAIFNEITGMVHPDLINFFDKYIIGKEKPDYKNAFNIIGVDYIKKYEGDIPLSILNGGYGVEMAMERVRMYNIIKADPNSIFKVGDKIRYTDFGEDCRKPFINENGGFYKSGTFVNLPIIRDGKECKLRITTECKQGKYYYKLRVNKGMTPDQLKCYNKWLNL